MEGGRIALGTCLAFPPPCDLVVMLISGVTVLNKKSQLVLRLHVPLGWNANTSQ